MAYLACSCSVKSLILSSICSINSTNLATAPEARPDKCCCSTMALAAYQSGKDSARAQSRIWLNVLSPMPRAGVLITRSNAASS